MTELTNAIRHSYSPEAAQLQLGDGSRLTLTRDGHPEPDAAILRRALAAASRVLSQSSTPEAKPSMRLGMVCGDHRMHQLVDMVERVGPTDASVLVTGDNGTGKELVARAVHDCSLRARKPFIAVNCSALNDSLLESELFGHRRGAFTGAVDDRVGMFEAADGGTLFLDEVGDMSPALQVRVLRVLQEGQVTPVGDVHSRQVDVRVVAATNRDLQHRVATGEFREDLFYRLHVVALHLPALRERQDLDALIDYFTSRLNEKLGTRKTLSEAAYAQLRRHHWPGNIRELANELERLWVLSDDEAFVGAQHLRASLGASPPPRGAAIDLPEHSDAPLTEAMNRVERELIRRALERAGGNRTHTARALGISRRNLLRKIAALDL